MGVEYFPPVIPGAPDRGPARPAFPVPTRLPNRPEGPPQVQPGAPGFEIRAPVNPDRPR